jgi:hypothetical protein
MPSDGLEWNRARGSRIVVVEPLLNGAEPRGPEMPGPDRDPADADLEDRSTASFEPGAHAPTPEPPARRFLPGMRFGDRYRIVEMLGRSATGEVYRADDLKRGSEAWRARSPDEVKREGVMKGRVIGAGVLGALVMFVAAFVVNGFFGFTAGLELRPLPNEAAVYAVLKEAIVEPGGYVANPAVVPGRGFPANEPVFRIRYAGVGHEAAGRLQLLRLVVILVATTLAAWIASMASGRVLSSYARRFGFFVLMGLWLAVFSDLPQHDIGSHPWRSAVALAAYDLALWALAGAVMAWRLRPTPAPTGA